MPLSMTVTLTGGTQGQQKTKLAGFIFFDKFQLTKIVFYTVLKQFNAIIIIIIIYYCYYY